MYNSYVSKEQKELERKVGKDFSLEKAYEVMKDQAKIGERLTGKPGALKEVNLIRKQLESYGFETKTMEFDAQISLPVEAQLKVLSPESYDIKVAPWPWSTDTPPGGLEGELVYVGYGKEEDYVGKDVRGKIVLASLGGNSRARKTEVCMSKEPKALVTFNNLHGGCIQQGTAKSALGNAIPEMNVPPYVPNVPLVTMDNKSGLKLVEMCKQGSVKVWLKTLMDTGWEKAFIVESRITGTVEPEKFVMLAGHYDTYGPEGVLCNAVGIAAMLEFARVFNQYRDQLRRSIRFVFWGAHECVSGGSGPWYIDNNWEDVRRNLVLYSFLDTVGMKDHTVLLSYSSDELIPFYEDLIKEVGFPSYMKKVKFGIPSGADISTFMMYACVPTNRDVSGRDYGKYQDRMDFMHTDEDTMKLAGPNMFETAFRTLAPMYLRFCNMPILPLDFSKQAEKLVMNLNSLNDIGNKLVDLDLAVKYAEDFKEEYALLYETGERVQSAFDEAFEAGKGEFNDVFATINDTLIKLNKTINRILYNGFHKWEKYCPGTYYNSQDITEILTIPMMDPIRTLVNLQPGTDEYGTLLTLLVRNRNKVTDLLEEAIEIVKHGRIGAEKQLRQYKAEHERSIE